MIGNRDQLWKALAEPVRREIIEALAEKPMTTGDLVERFDRLCRTAVMKHLDVLVAADLVAVERNGRVRWNRLNREPLERICLPWVVSHARKMSSSLDRLKAVVESGPIETETKPKSKTPSKKAKTCRT